MTKTPRMKDGAAAPERRGPRRCGLQGALTATSQATWGGWRNERWRSHQFCNLKSIQVHFTCRHALAHAQAMPPKKPQRAASVEAHTGDGSGYQGVEGGGADRDGQHLHRQRDSEQSCPAEYHAGLTALRPCINQHLHAANLFAEFDSVLPQNRRQRRRRNIDVDLTATAFDGSADSVQLRVACCQMPSQVAGNREDDP